VNKFYSTLYPRKLRVLDLGTGDGRMITLLKEKIPTVECFALGVEETIWKGQFSEYCST
jgi:ubiquinone/menaquinone biosynthesis C-methylase UbiE